MRLVESGPRRLLIRGRNPTQAPALAGFVLVVLGLLGPLLAAELSLTQLACTAILLAGGGELLRRSWARQVRLELDLAERVLRNGARVVPIHAARSLRLGPSSARPAVDHAAYEVQLDLPRGLPALLRGTDPAGVLHDAAVLAERMNLRVEPGWGLGDEKLACLGLTAGDGGSPKPSPNDHSAPILAGSGTAQLSQSEHRKLGVTLAIAAGLLSYGLVEVLLARSRTGLAVNPLSLGLGAVALAIIYVLTVCCLSWSLQVSCGPEGVVITRRGLGRRSSVERLARADIRRAYAVSPASGEPARHVLLLTSSGPAAVPLRGSAAHELVRLLSEESPLSNRCPRPPPGRRG